ncbi:hypothetical protein V1278_005498 [Bradyrhizobium sp. AZCC 1577]
MRDFLIAVSLVEATQLFPTIPTSPNFYRPCAGIISVVLTP